MGSKRVAVTSAIILAVASMISACEPSAPVRFAATPLVADRLDGTGLAIVQLDGRVYVGGTFGEVRGPDGRRVAGRANLAAFDVTTGRLVAGFRADTDGPVQALATDGVRLFVGGSFATIGGVARARLAALDPTTGRVDAGFRADADSNVYSLAVASGHLVVGGSFSALAGRVRSRFAVVDGRNGAVLGPAPSFNDTVLSVGGTADGSHYFAGGSFSRVGATTQRWSAVLGADGSLAPAQLAGIGGPVSVFRPTADGQSVEVSQLGSANAGGRWRLSDGQRQWQQRCDGDAQAIDELDGIVYTGFHEGCEGDTTIRLTANDASTGTRDRTFVPAFDRFWGVQAIDAAPTALAIAGDFTSVGGVAAQGFALFPPTTAPRGRPGV